MMTSINAMVTPMVIRQLVVTQGAGHLARTGRSLLGSHRRRRGGGVAAGGVAGPVAAVGVESAMAATGTPAGAGRARGAARL